MKTKVLFAILLFGIAIGSMAQEKGKRFGFELNGGASVATRQLGGADLNPGLGFEGIFHYRFMPFTGVYAGWGWNRFGSDHSFAGNDVCFEETGYLFGLQYKHPIGASPVNYYLRAGGLYNHIEIENAEGEITMDSGHGLGWQLAGGIAMPLGSGWSFTPGLKFNALKRDVDNVDITVPLILNYVSLRVGVVKTF